MTTDTDIQQTTTVYPLEMQRVDRGVALKIHEAIHTPNLSNIILPSENGIEIPYIISRAPNGCRQLIYNKIRFMEQNKDKSSTYAELAKQGHKVTWGIRDDKWIYILDNKIM